MFILFSVNYFSFISHLYKRDIRAGIIECGFFQNSRRLSLEFFGKIPKNLRREKLRTKIVLLEVYTFFCHLCTVMLLISALLLISAPSN